MRVLIIGMPHFARKLAGDLAEVDLSNTYVQLDPSGVFADKIRYVLMLPRADLVYMVGGTPNCGGSLRTALFLRKKIVMHWVGTDVILAQRALADKSIDVKLMKRSRHLCEISWIQKELLDIGIHAKVVPIAGFSRRESDPAPFPDKFSILSYLGEGREEFYGMEQLISIAEDFPEIELRIAGIRSYSGSVPSNVKLLGWISDMARKLQECVLYLRLTEHDGMSFSVLEALWEGRYVAYTQNFEGAIFVPNYERLKELVQQLLSEYTAKTLAINKAGVDFVTRNFDKRSIMRNLAEELRSRHGQNLDQQD